MSFNAPSSLSSYRINLHSSSSVILDFLKYTEEAIGEK